MPLNPRDVPTGIATSPHSSGAGVTVDADAMVRHQPMPLLPIAQIIAEMYGAMLDGNPIGSVGMAGLVPEKLLWSTVAGYCQTRGIRRLDAWISGLLHLIDGIRLKHEFERIERDAKKK